MKKFDEKTNIRKYKPSDRAVILQIYQASSKKAHRFLSPKYQLKEKERMERNLPESEVIVIERYGKVEGFTSIKEDAMSGFFIRPNVQGKGLGSDLMQYIQSHKKKIKLCVYEGNLKAISFYEYCGFSETESKINEENNQRYIEMQWEAQ